MKIHKVVAGSVLAAGVGVAGLFGAGMASADANSTGGYCVKSANGCAAAAKAGAQDGTGAGAGAFGAFGTFGDGPHDYGHLTGPTDTAIGANGFKTGLNNSGIAGNRQSTQSDPTP